MSQEEVQNKLFKRAGKLLAGRSYSRGEMRAKLVKLADLADVEDALNRLEALNLLNDADYAYNFALSRISLHGWGPIRVRSSLLQHHVAAKLIDAALERVCRDVDEAGILRAYVKRHCGKAGFPKDRKGLQKLAGHLRRRGFTDAVIYSAMRQVIPGAAWECFDTGD